MKGLFSVRGVGCVGILVLYHLCLSRIVGAESGLPQTELRSINGKSVIYVAGRPLEPFMFRGNWQTIPFGDPALEQNELTTIERAAQSGQDLFGVNSATPWWQSPQWIDTHLRNKLELAPEGKFLALLYMAPSPDWANANPAELYTEEGGSRYWPHASVTSRPWRQAVRDQLAQYLGQVRAATYSQQIIGFNLCYHNTAENFLFETHNPAAHYDFSPCTRTAFRDWLRERYQHNEVGLQEAWNDGAVTFATADIPSSTERAQTNSMALRDPAGGGTRLKVPDYYQFMANENATTLLSMAGAVKEFDQRQSLVGASFGYLFELAQLGNRGAHLDFGPILASTDIDIVWAPFSYADRDLGGTPSMHGPFDSIALHNKLCFQEEDTLDNWTYLKSEPIDVRFQMLRRNFFYGFIHNFAVWQLDLFCQGTYLDQQYWEEFARWRQITRTRLFKQGAYDPQIAALGDGLSVTYLRTPDSSLAAPLLSTARKELEHAGTSVGYYLQDDLNLPAFPDSARLLVFMDLFKADDALIDRIHASLAGREVTVVWLCAPGLITDRLDDEAMSRLTGITLRHESRGTLLNTRITNNTHPITAGNGNRVIGTNTQYGPAVYVDDASATKLGEYAYYPGMVSMAVKQVGTWRSVFIGTPEVPTDIWRRCAQFAGCEIYSNHNDVVTRNGALMMVHTGPTAGYRDLYFPDNGDAQYQVYEVFGDRVVAQQPGISQIQLAAKTTYLYLMGSPDRQVSIWPGLPVDDDDLELATVRGIYGSHTADYHWYRNGAEQPQWSGPIVSASATSPGEVWRCEMWLDGQRLGEDTVTIGGGTAASPTPALTGTPTPTDTFTATGTPSSTPTVTPRHPDMNGDGKIDELDLFEFSQGWQETDFGQ